MSLGLGRVKPLARILAEGDNATHGLKRSLGAWSLAAMGVGAIIGTGIFVLTGVASATRAGPAITISFVVAGIVSALAALCYSEVSTKLPISGSAYTYTYATLGEFLAWIVGWGLCLEYALGASTVSVGWSGYFVTIFQAVGINLPTAWTHSPFDPTPGVMNLPAAIIVFVLTALLIRGTRESGRVNAIIVAIKVAIVVFFIALGVGHIDPANYHLPAGPLSGLGGYFPFGIAGMMGGAAFTFFAYIGFDAVSTAAEEAKNPSRDLPFGIITSLVVCTILYIIVVAILNGMVPFYKLNVAAPVAFAMSYVGLPWASLVISVGAIAGLTTVMLVMMFGQSRVFFSMSRDGLLPSVFATLHPAWRTPWISQLIFGVLIAAGGAFFPISILGSLTNMGTLLAFVLTSAAVPVLRKRHPELVSAFVVPGGPYVLPALSAITAVILMYFLRDGSPLVWGFFPLVWLSFLVWFVLGLVVYFTYSRRKSKLSPLYSGGHEAQASDPNPAHV